MRWQGEIECQECDVTLSANDYRAAVEQWNTRVGTVTRTDMEKLNKRILAFNCMEWGFKASEKGANFDAAKTEFLRLYDGKRD
jgi:hypothetical protein